MSDPSELPYHVQAIYDLKENYSADHFRYAIRICRKVIGNVIAGDDRSDRQVARVRILRHLDLLLSRAVMWIDAEADLIAIISRSAIELRGWAELVSETPERATQFLTEDVIYDAHDLNKYMHKSFPQVPAVPHSGEKYKDPPRLGHSVDYDFKLCSKLIHPTALLLNHPELTIRNEDNKVHLAVETLFYAWLIVNRFHRIDWQP